MYSFGIIMWELVNRVAKGNWELPFAEFNYSSPYQVLMQAAKNNRRPTMPPSVPQPIQDFYLRCVDPLPDNRPSSSQALTEITQMLYSYNANPVSWDGTTTS
ncbi:hypothetical protein Pelo_15434 [Pelomyxa schiedti]|nr:hypothetical protein Pelo_15434 [Pelomyxa schiedti]